MKVPPLLLKDLTVKVPIIQGGMGVGVSRSSLAGAVALEGGIGIISGVQIGFLEADFESNTKEANIRALRKEIKMAKQISKDGIIGVNFMVAMNNYDEMVRAAVEEKVDLIISGAGLPTRLPALVKECNTKIAPIVSSGKAAAIICKMWDKRYQCIPDLIVVEGPEAGGHLGFHLEDLEPQKKPDLKNLVIEVIEAVSLYEKKYNRKIPIVAAGGIYTGEDIAQYLKIGASAVQMGTRFVATTECDADIRYKMAYINSNKEDIEIIKSPVGMPGRAIRNKFIKEVEKSTPKITKCYNCLKSCNPEKTPYCISKALIEAVKGNVEQGLIFTGSNAYRLKNIVSVRELMNELVLETEKYL